MKFPGSREKMVRMLRRLLDRGAPPGHHQIGGARFDDAQGDAKNEAKGGDHGTRHRCHSPPLVGGGRGFPSRREGEAGSVSRTLPDGRRNGTADSSGSSGRTPKSSACDVLERLRRAALAEGLSLETGEPSADRRPRAKAGTRLHGGDRGAGGHLCRKRKKSSYFPGSSHTGSNGADSSSIALTARDIRRREGPSFGYSRKMLPRMEEALVKFCRSNSTRACS